MAADKTTDKAKSDGEQAKKGPEADKIEADNQEAAKKETKKKKAGRKIQNINVKETRDKIAKRVKKMIPHKDDDPENRFFKIIVYSFIGIILLTIIAGTLTFFFTLEGGEETLVPDVTELNIVDALINLQERGLVAQIQTRHFNDPNLKDSVLEQVPDPGTLVKAGRKITLTVSLGPVIDQVGNYIGRNLEEVRQEILILSATYKPLLQIADENVSYTFSLEEPGTILEQYPDPSTELAGLTNLTLLVSRGPDEGSILVPTFLGYSSEQALNLIAGLNQRFLFEIDWEIEDQQAGTVIAQEPESGVNLNSEDMLTLKISPPEDIPEETVFNIFQYELPNYATPVEVDFELVNPDGERKSLFSMEHPGGPIAFPYFAPEGGLIVVKSFGVEIGRQAVQNIVDPREGPTDS